MGKALLAAIGGIGAAFASALCCTGPLVAVALGVSGAGFATTFEPLPSLLPGRGGPVPGGGLLPGSSRGNEGL